MNASTTIGSIIVVILLAGAVGAYINLSLPQPTMPTFIAPAEYAEVYVGKPEDYPNVKTVNINVSLSAGGLELKTTSEDLLYMLGFTRGWEKPTVKTEVSGGSLTVSASASDGGGLEVLLGRNYVYNLNFTFQSAGFRFILSDQIQVESLKLTAASGGGYLSLEDSLSLKSMELSLGSGGVILDIKAEGLKGLSNIAVNINSGGVIVKPLKLGDVGCKIRVEVESGGLSFKPENFTVIESTERTCEMATPNYESADNRLNILVSIGSGGAIINQEPTEFFKQIPQIFTSQRQTYH